MRMKVIKIVLCIVLIFSLITFSFLLGYNLKEKPTEVKVYLEGKDYTFRDSEGHRLSAIEKENTVYVPLVDDFLFFDYSVNLQDDSVNLIKEVKEDYIEFDTETLENVSFTNEDLLNYSFTMFINWAPWCPDCKAFFEDFVKYKDELADNNIQVIGLPILKDETDTEYVKVLKVMKEYQLDFKNLKVNEYLKKQLQSNLLNIPSICIIDNKGKIVYDNDNVNLLLSNILEDLKNIQICDEC